MAGIPLFIPSFGRRKGHKLHPGRDKLMNMLLPQLLILPEEIPAFSSPLWFEIGFGGGEHLAEQARRNPDICFIGCEPYINGIASLLATIAEHNLTNIRLFDGDARLLLEKLPDNAIEKLFVLFPDPWPKARHHKRRIISQPTLTLFHQKLKAGGLLRLATDHADYGEWMLEQLLAFNGFKWKAKSHEGWQEPPQDWVVTRYQSKAENEGRRAIFLDFNKILIYN